MREVGLCIDSFVRTWYLIKRMFTWTWNWILMLQHHLLSESAFLPFFVHFFLTLGLSVLSAWILSKKKVSTLETIHFLSTKDCTLYLLTVWNSFEVCPLYYWKNKGINWMIGAIKSTINLIFGHQLKVLPLPPQPPHTMLHTYFCL